MKILTDRLLNISNMETSKEKKLITMGQEHFVLIAIKPN